MSASSQSDSGDVETRVKAAHRQATMMVGSMISSLFAYAVVVEIMSRKSGVDAGPEGPEIIRWVFYAVAVSMVFAGHVAKAFMLRGFRAGNIDELLARLTTANVVTAAIAETPAVLGFVLFFLDRRFYSDFYILALISLYLLVRHFPRHGQWERMIREYTTEAG